MRCPLCGGPVSSAEREYHIREVADDGVELFWACDSCYWVDSQQCPWSFGPDGREFRPSKPLPPQPTELGRRYFGDLYASLEAFVQQDSAVLTEEGSLAAKRLRRQLRSLRSSENRIRKAVGNSGRRKRPALEGRFIRAFDERLEQ